LCNLVKIFKDFLLLILRYAEHEMIAVCEKRELDITEAVSVSTVRVRSMCHYVSSYSSCMVLL